MAKTITQLPPASTVTATTVLPADNAAATATEKVTVAQIVGLAPVQAVAGRTGNVALAVADIGGLQTALDGKATAGAHGSTHSAGGTDAATLCDTFIFTRSSAPASATGSNGDYQWTVPATAKLLTVDAIGGGGGGGSGRRGAAGTVRGGGGSGASAPRCVFDVMVAELQTANLWVFVGVGGAGGAAVAANDTNGNAGAVGSRSWVLGGTNYLAWSWAGTGGGGGTASGGGAGGSPQWLGTHDGAMGVAGGGATPAGTGGNMVRMAPSSGGGGGGISAADVAGAGGTGGGVEIARGAPASAVAAGGTAGGGNGVNGNASVNGGGGAGGSGGGASITTAGGNGGNGGAYGGGGGGGGASLNGFNSGAGGNGGDGVVRITVWY